MGGPEHSFTTVLSDAAIANPVTLIMTCVQLGVDLHFAAAASIEFVSSVDELYSNFAQSITTLRQRQALIHQKLRWRTQSWERKGLPQQRATS